jgi:hypothetical protein
MKAPSEAPSTTCSPGPDERRGCRSWRHGSARSTKSRGQADLLFPRPRDSFAHTHQSRLGVTTTSSEMAALACCERFEAMLAEHGMEIGATITRRSCPSHALAAWRRRWLACNPQPVHAAKVFFKACKTEPASRAFASHAALVVHFESGALQIGTARLDPLTLRPEAGLTCRNASRLRLPTDFLHRSFVLSVLGSSLVHAPPSAARLLFAPAPPTSVSLARLAGGIGAQLNTRAERRQAAS